MRNRATIWIATFIYAVACWSAARAATQRAPCDNVLVRGIPARSADAPAGRLFAEEIRGLSDDERERRIERELLTGNIPAFLRRLVPIRLNEPLPDGQPIDVVVCAAPDYLAIGSDDDFMLIPMRLGTALSVANRFGFTLPTPRIVDAIYAQAAVHFVPQPLPASSRMRSTDYYWRHNELVGRQRAALDVLPGRLTAGDKKDLVITNRLWSHLDRVAIYGWHAASGQAIQSLSTFHGWHYADYSHGARLISTWVFVDGKANSIFQILQDPRLAGALSDEGVVINALELTRALSAPAQVAIASVLPDSHSAALP